MTLSGREPGERASSLPQMCFAHSVISAVSATHTPLSYYMEKPWVALALWYIRKLHQTDQETEDFSVRGHQKCVHPAYGDMHIAHSKCLA